MTTGVILLILGLALMLEAAYGLLAPVLPFLLGILSLWLGARLISTKVKGAGASEQNMVFRRGSVDLSDEDRDRVTVNVICGITHIIPPSGRQVRVDLSCVVAQVPLPDGASNVVGRRRFLMGEGEDPPLKLQVNVVCGIVRFVNRPAEPALKLLSGGASKGLAEPQVLNRLGDIVDSEHGSPPLGRRPRQC